MSIKSWITSTIIKKYAGSWTRGAMRFLAGFLVAHALADQSTAEAFSGSLGTILLAIIQNPELLTAAASAIAGQWWSLKEKKDKIEKDLEENK